MLITLIHHPDYQLSTMQRHRTDTTCFRDVMDFGANAYNLQQLIGIF